MMSADEIRELLKQVKYPGFSRDIVSFGLVKAVEVAGGDVTVWLGSGVAFQQSPFPLRAGGGCT